jgi:type IV pilus assembly protein PilW
MAELSTNNTFVITPLVEGIEYMQVDYGIDSDGDGALNGSYSSCSACTTDDWSKVVSVKVNLISRNLVTTNGYTDSYTYNLGTAGSVAPADGYKRHAYTQVMRLVNPSSRKE